MTDTQETEVEVKEVIRTTPQTDELAALKERANLIGLKYHPNIGLDKLKAKVNGQLSKDSTQLKKEAVAAKNAAKLPTSVEPLPNGPYTFDKPLTRVETPAMRRARLRKKSARLVRYKLTCMNENKKKWPGEIMTAMNSSIGTISRYIPFNAESWHCEDMLLNVIKERKYVTFVESAGKKGRKVKRPKLVPEFAIQELPPLTTKEIAELKTKQALANNIGED